MPQPPREGAVAGSDGQSADKVPDLALALAITLLRHKPATVDIPTYICHLRASLPLSIPIRSTLPESSTSSTYFRSLIATSDALLANLRSELEVLKAEQSFKSKNAVGGWKKGTKCERNWGARMREVEEERKAVGGLVSTGCLGARLAAGVRRLAVVEGDSIVEAVEEVRETVREVLRVLLEEGTTKTNKASKQDGEKVLRGLETLWDRVMYAYSSVDAPATSVLTSRLLYVVIDIFNLLLTTISTLSTTIYAVLPQEPPFPNLRMGIMSLLLVSITKLRPGFSHERCLLEALLHALLMRLGDFLVMQKLPGDISQNFESSMARELATRDTCWYYVHLLRGIWAVYACYLDSTGKTGAAAGGSQFVEDARRRLIEKTWETVKDGDEVTMCTWAVVEVQRLFGWDMMAFTSEKVAEADGAGIGG